MLRWILGFGTHCKFPCNHHHKLGFRNCHKYNLVNLKLEEVKDHVLDAVVKREREIKAAWVIVSMIAADPGGCLPVDRLSVRRVRLGLPKDLEVSTFIRKYPNIFDEFHAPDGGFHVPWFRLTPDAMKLFQESTETFRQNEKECVDRVCKLLMLAKDMLLPLPTIDKLKWDLGLPCDYVDSFIPNYKDLFSIIRLSDDRVALKLLSRSHELAVSQLEMTALSQGKEEDVEARRLAFPIGFPRGYKLNLKSIDRLDKLQRLRYTSPYADSSRWDPRTYEKRIVGVFHELLHLTIQKKTEPQNVSDLREPLALPRKFTKVFERHPGIFYISKKNNMQTVVLREAYDGHRLIHEHPIVEIRDRLGCLMKEGSLKGVKCNYLDDVVNREREIKEVWAIVSSLAVEHDGCLPMYQLYSLSEDLKVSHFMTKYPNIFDEFRAPDSDGRSGFAIPWLRVTPDAMKLFQESVEIFRQNEKDCVDRVCKLLMLTKDMILPLPTIDQLKWDLGLPYDYVDSFIPNYEDLFALIRLPNNCVALKLISRPSELAVSQLELNALSQGKEEDVAARRLAFPVGNQKSINWSDEWQRLPYTSPYSDSSRLDPQTSEKKIVGVFHELLHLTVQKKIEHQDVINLQKPLALSQKFTKVLERHPGIFYISKKKKTQTVVLQEAYDGNYLIHKHPIAEIRDRFGCLMEKRSLNRSSRGLYKNQISEYSAQESSEGGTYLDYFSDDTRMFWFSD